MTGKKLPRFGRQNGPKLPKDFLADVNLRTGKFEDGNLETFAGGRLVGTSSPSITNNICHCQRECDFQALVGEAKLVLPPTHTVEVGH